MKLKDLTSPFGRNRHNKRTEDNDLGFGTKITASGERLINPDGSFNIRRTGRWTWTPYQDLVEMSWPLFLLLIGGVFVGINALFAAGFVWIGIEALSGVEPAGRLLDFLNCFFFSVQTFTTVGYGAVSPMSTETNILASLNALVGLLAFAVATGLVFARFARPKAQIAFSKKALITELNGQPSFQFRIVNLRDNKIINLEVQLTMTWLEDQGDQRIRRFAGLQLMRDKVFLFPLNWTLVHPIAEESPLYGLSPEELTAREAEFLILVQGYDETFAQTVHANSSYTCAELEWGVFFAPMYYSEGSRTILRLDRLSQTEPGGRE